MKIICLSILILFFIGCNQHPMKNTVNKGKYQESVSPIYYIGETDILNPAIIMIDSVLYISSKDIIFSSSDVPIQNRKGVYLYMTKRLLDERFCIDLIPPIIYPEEIGMIEKKIV